MIDPSTTLKKLRTDARNARRSITPSDRSRASTRIANRFLNSRYFFRSNTIGCYVSTPDEVDTSEIIERAWRAKKRVFLPVTASNGQMFFRETRPATGLAKNEFGLWEPVSGQRIDASRLDVVVTPLVAFDDQGNRIEANVESHPRRPDRGLSALVRFHLAGLGGVLHSRPQETTEDSDRDEYKCQSKEPNDQHSGDLVTH